jgi:serine/threonine protein kinase
MLSDGTIKRNSLNQRAIFKVKENEKRHSVKLFRTPEKARKEYKIQSQIDPYEKQYVKAPFGSSLTKGFVVGSSLRDLLDVHEYKETCMDWETAFQVAVGLLNSLAAIHNAGIVHLDINPKNVIVNLKSTPIRTKVIDFGMSLTLQEFVNTSEAIGGTIGYRAPETRAEGDKTMIRSNKVDIYAAGMILTAIFNEKFKKSNAGKLISNGLVSLIEKMKNEDPINRPSAREVIKELNSIHTPTENMTALPQL